MDGPAHYREAEKLLKHLLHLEPSILSVELVSGIIGQAQVHATLALAAATREIGDLDTMPRRREGVPPLDPPQPGDFECCASGRCEVCAPGYIWGRG